MNKEVNVEKMVLTTEEAYSVLDKFLKSDDSTPEVSKRMMMKINVAQTVIKAHYSQKIAEAKNAATHVSIATAILDNTEERKKYLSITLPGISKALPDSQKPDELRQIEGLQNKSHILEETNNKLLLKIADMGKEMDDLKFKLMQEEDKNK